MKYRRNVSQFADSLQTCAAEIFGTFVHQTRFGCCLCRASGSNDNDIFGDTFFHQLDVSGIRSYLRVVTSYHSNCATDNAGCNTFDQRFCSSGLVNLCIGNAVQNFYNCFYRVTNGCFLFNIRNVYQFRFSVLEVFDRHFYDGFCILACCFCVESDEFRIWHLSDGRSGDKLRMETFGKRAKRREDTLYVNDDCLTCTGQNHIFLLQEVTCHRDTATHCNFVGCTAYTGYGDAFSAHFFCICDHLRIVCIFADHLGQ